jgi:hypothetical protein
MHAFQKKANTRAKREAVACFFFDFASSSARLQSRTRVSMLKLHFIVFIFSVLVVIVACKLFFSTL